MPHSAFKLLPGVDQNKTPALNEAAISDSTAIRFKPDPTGTALPEKLGGWTRYFPQTMPSIPRGLWAWEDFNHVARLAVGCETAGGSQGGPLIVISNGTSRTRRDVWGHRGGTHAFCGSWLGPYD